MIFSPILAKIPGFTVDLQPSNWQTILLPLDESRPDAESIVAYLNDMADQFGRSVYVREFTQKYVLGNVGDNAIQSHLEKIRAFVMDRVKYVRDPTGAEYIISPVKMLSEILQTGSSRGDCDDHVLLLNSMLNSVGFKTRVAGVKINGSSLFNHVISQVYFAGAWLDIDPTNKGSGSVAWSEKLLP
jgi:transglutaminase-like putative cysteine protease